MALGCHLLVTSRPFPGPCHQQEANHNLVIARLHELRAH